MRGMFVGGSEDGRRGGGGGGEGGGVGAIFGEFVDTFHCLLQGLVERRSMTPTGEASGGEGGGDLRRLGVRLDENQ